MYCLNLQLHLVLLLLFLVGCVRGDLNSPSTIDEPLFLPYTVYQIQPSAFTNTLYALDSNGSTASLTLVNLNGSDGSVTTPRAHFPLLTGCFTNTYTPFVEMQAGNLLVFAFACASQNTTTLVTANLSAVVHSLQIAGLWGIDNVTSGPNNGDLYTFPWSGAVNFFFFFTWNSKENVLQQTGETIVLPGTVGIIVVGPNVYTVSPDLCQTSLSAPLPSYICYNATDVENLGELAAEFSVIVTTPSQQQLIWGVGKSATTLIIFDLPSMVMQVNIELDDFVDIRTTSMTTNGEVMVYTTAFSPCMLDLSINGQGYIISVFPQIAAIPLISSAALVADAFYTYVCYQYSSDNSKIFAYNTEPYLSPYLFTHFATFASIFANSLPIIQPTEYLEGLWFFWYDSMYFVNMSKVSTPIAAEIDTSFLNLSNLRDVPPTVFFDETGRYLIFSADYSTGNVITLANYTGNTSNPLDFLFEFTLTDGELLDADVIFTPNNSLCYFISVIYTSAQTMIIAVNTIPNTNGAFSITNSTQAFYQYNVASQCAKKPNEPPYICTLSFNWQSILQLSVTNTSINFAVCISTPLTSNFSIVEFAFLPTTNSLVTISSIQVGGCIYIQSEAVGTGMWVLCAAPSDSHYFLLRYNFPNPALTCRIDFATTWVPQQKNILEFWFNEEGTRLGVIQSQKVTVYNVKNCQMGKQVKTLYSIPVSAPYVGGIYTIAERPTQILALVTRAGALTLYPDCVAGYQPAAINYCAQCPFGYAGVACTKCPAGFVCDSPGLVAPTTLCPAGAYCEPGTNNGNTGDGEHSPYPCPEGAYCPGGIATSMPSPMSINNSPRLCINDYYCPLGSPYPTLQCPQYTKSKQGSANIADCECITGYYGFNGTCVKCPESCNCTGPYISNCWINPETLGNSTLLGEPLVCPAYSVTGKNQCNPQSLPWNGTGTFPCETGYQGRLCSECEPDYFSNGRQCSACENYMTWLLPLTYLGIIFVVFTYAWRVSPTDSASVSITAFHFQSLVVLLLGGIQWDSFVLHYLHLSSNTNSFSYVAIECLFPWWNLLSTLLFVVLLPLFCAILVCLCASVIAGITYALNHKSTNLQKEMRNLQYKVVNAIVILTNLCYFYIVVIVFNMMGCNQNPDGVFLNMYPFIECRWNGEWRTYMSIAMVALVFEVLGLPLTMVVKLWKSKPRLEEDKLYRTLGSMYSMYNSSCYLWDSLVILRRLLIASLAAVVPYENPMLAIAFFVIILTYFVLLSIFKPYRRTVDYALDSLSQCVLLMTLFGGVLATDFEILSVVIVSLNLGFLICCVIVIVPNYKKRLTPIFLRYMTRQKEPPLLNERTPLINVT